MTHWGISILGPEIRTIAENDFVFINKMNR